MDNSNNTALSITEIFYSQQKVTEEANKTITEL